MQHKKEKVYVCITHYLRDIKAQTKWPISFGQPVYQTMFGINMHKASIFTWIIFKSYEPLRQTNCGVKYDAHDACRVDKGC